MVMRCCWPFCCHHVSKCSTSGRMSVNGWPNGRTLKGAGAVLHLQSYRQVAHCTNLLTSFVDASKTGPDSLAMGHDYAAVPPGPAGVPGCRPVTFIRQGCCGRTVSWWLLRPRVRDMLRGTLLTFFRAAVAAAGCEGAQLVVMWRGEVVLYCWPACFCTCL